MKQLQIMQTEASKAQEEAQQALKKELRKHQQLKLQLEQNKTLSDDIQRQLETLQLEKVKLQSDKSDTCKTPLRSLCNAFWNQTFSSCFDFN